HRAIPRRCDNLFAVRTEFAINEGKFVSQWANRFNASQSIDNSRVAPIVHENVPAIRTQSQELPRLEMDTRTDCLAVSRIPELEPVSDCGPDSFSVRSEPHLFDRAIVRDRRTQPLARTGVPTNHVCLVPRQQ